MSDPIAGGDPIEQVREDQIARVDGDQVHLSVSKEALIGEARGW